MTQERDAPEGTAPEGMQDFAAEAAPSDIAPPIAAPAHRAGLLGRLDRLDHSLTERILVKAPLDGRPKRWVVVLRRFSEAGSYGVGWIVLFAVVGIVSDGLLRGAVAAALVVGMLLFNTGIKGIFKRPRPLQRAIEHAPASYSMPSAHTSMAMVGAATMHVIVPDFAAVWWGIAIALGISRVMLGMHFLGDVLAGALLGLAVGLLVAAPLVAAI
ncbi:MAG: family phosphohydrolase [Thermoleophilia bacterium]|nr:family phosphohydrolase [Thermoleophilia bacterium]